MGRDQVVLLGPAGCRDGIPLQSPRGRRGASGGSPGGPDVEGPALPGRPEQAEASLKLSRRVSDAGGSPPCVSRGAPAPRSPIDRRGGAHRLPPRPGVPWELGPTRRHPTGRAIAAREPPLASRRRTGAFAARNSNPTSVTEPCPKKARADYRPTPCWPRSRPVRHAARGVMRWRAWPACSPGSSGDSKHRRTTPKYGQRPRIARPASIS